MSHRERQGILEPVPHALARVLRRAVLEHGRSEERRSYPPTLRVGFPGGAQRCLEVGAPSAFDHTLRTEVAQAIARDFLVAGRVPLLWLTRPFHAGDEHDRPWSAAVHAAGSELGVALDLVVVTKQSWRDPRTTTGRTWQRPIRVR
ncbi:hypothetical protein E8D34_02435 [Nocardioides sp. GY 10113]|uniref:hypothetical protein n=1 Tax=Nocardioides sp. GY 10113 TaxID=2569761 RepID=UPI0010A75CD4|nr:hypothetical protein [Nocardioides sp. GY 10113]TIC88563.1 hypothetical protein E8D34_02435 [Nocardioides sp. GY 10113]